MKTKIEGLSTKCLSSRKTQTNNEIEDVIKLINSLENRRMLLKGTSRKIVSQKRESLSFLSPLVRVVLLLMKNVLTSLVESVLIPLGLTTATSVADATIHKKMYGSGMTKLIFQTKKWIIS